VNERRGSPALVRGLLALNVFVGLPLAVMLSVLVSITDGGLGFGLKPQFMPLFAMLLVVHVFSCFAPTYDWPDAQLLGRDGALPVAFVSWASACAVVLWFGLLLVANLSAA